MALAGVARREARARLAVTPFDVIVVGGDLVGAGIALDAAARGLRTALLEPEDFGAGRCSGGSDLWPLLLAPASSLSPRHLLDVVEAAAERQYLRQIAPHLVGELPIVVPVPRPERGEAGPATGWGAWLDGARRVVPAAGRRARQLALTSPDELTELAPGLRTADLEGGWVSTRVEVDEAVLTLALARTAASDGAAVVLNGASLRIDAARGQSPRVLVEADGEAFELHARVVVEGQRPAPGGAAGGVGRRLRFLRATLPRQVLPLDAALVLPGDGQAPTVCCLPVRGHTRLGMVVEGAAARPAGVDGDALRALLQAVARWTSAELHPEHVTAAWEEACPPVEEGGGGDEPSLRRPLQEVVPGWARVLDGTVTTYRELARQTVDAVVDGLDERTRLRLHRRSLTHRIRLRGASGWADVRDGRDLGPAGELLGEEDRHRLAHRYGGEARVLLAMLHHRPAWRRPAVEGLPHLDAEVVYAVRYEWATSLVDVAVRRLPCLLEAPEATMAAAGRLSELVGDEAGWDVRRRAAEIEALRAEARRRLVGARAAAPRPR